MMASFSEKPQKQMTQTKTPEQCASCADNWASKIVQEWCGRNKIDDLPSDKRRDLIRLIKAGILHFQLGNEPNKLSHPNTSNLIKLLSDTR